MKTRKKTPFVRGILAGVRQEREKKKPRNPFPKGTKEHAEWREGLSEWWDGP